MSQFLVEHLRAIAGDPPAAAATLEERVRQAICERLGKQTLAMDALAQELGMSTRTLSRRLVEHRTSYHEILDRVRRELADDLLVDPDNKILGRPRPDRWPERYRFFPHGPSLIAIPV